jgi:hypothetical protein
LLDTAVVDWGINIPFARLFILFFLAILLRRDWLASIVWVAILMLGSGVLGNEVLWIALPMLLVSGLLILFVATRIGLLSLTVLGGLTGIFSYVPMSFQASAWYANAGFAMMFLILGVGLYAFRTSLGSQTKLNLSRAGE